MAARDASTTPSGPAAWIHRRRETAPATRRRLDRHQVGRRRFTAERKALQESQDDQSHRGDQTGTPVGRKQADQHRGEPHHQQ